jgi:hypothetical protein
MAVLVQAVSGLIFQPTQMAVPLFNDAVRPLGAGFRDKRSLILGVLACVAFS